VSRAGPPAPWRSQQWSAPRSLAKITDILISTAPLCNFCTSLDERQPLSTPASSSQIQPLSRQRKLLIEIQSCGRSGRRSIERRHACGKRRNSTDEH
jgi:hypothetical protein